MINELTTKTYKNIKIGNTLDTKMLSSPEYNYIFNKHTGYFCRWGINYDDNEVRLPALEIADIEITTICHGINGRVCPWCYKSNTPEGKNMSFSTYKKIFRKLPDTLTQIAFGVDSELSGNPEWFDIFRFTRDNDIVPNVTIANVNEDTSKKLASVCGAVAVSYYEDKDVCYNTIARLNDAGLPYINIHALVCEERYDSLLQLLKDRETDKRLSNVTAIVFLSLKEKGRGSKYTSLSQDKFNNLVKISIDSGIGIGFDSCTAHSFMKAVEGYPNKAYYEQCCEPCESTLYSIYIDVDGLVYPCSFCEGVTGWDNGIDMLQCNDFISDIWLSPRIMEFRKRLLDNKRVCPLYKIR